ncbi:MAG: T9SS type A sorting domain-containing protein [Flavobacteriales bacterium]|nr:T9SS type A sorting domain-containing protein [Flavobacteriales bacterium]
MKKLLLNIILLFFFITAFSQKDTLMELNFNSTIIGERTRELNNEFSLLRNLNYKPSSKKKSSALPFFDDFSQVYHYPNPEKWEDKNVWVNNNFPVNPISYGVATFDGLDSTGYPYNFINPTAKGVADYLTTQPIDLSSITDSVYLSFFYQPQGNGNKPETEDSLRLEFFNPSDSSWTRKWAIVGSASVPFQQVMVPVDTTYHKNNFKFRFVNYATLSGNVDHWNLDYIYLNDQRSYTDTALYDVALTLTDLNLLKDYSRMPWSHYMVDTTANMDSLLVVEYKNHTDTTLAVFYQRHITEDAGLGASVEIYPGTSASKNVAPYSSLIDSLPVFSPSKSYEFYYPKDTTVVSKAFEVKTFFDLSTITDDHVENDTAIYYQVFSNDYAYDDGSAELGYGVQGIGAKLAHEFNIKKSDTLTGFKIYFTPITNNLSAKTFKLTVWSSLFPETVIYQQNGYYNPIYSLTNEYLEYQLDAPLFLNAGTYYIGWEKISEDFLNVGWDVNTKKQSKVFFNAVGVWENATYEGSLMLRPLFDAYPEPVISVNEITSDPSLIKVYPNPAKDELYFTTNQKINTLQIYDVMGNLIVETILTNKAYIDTKHLSNGMYFIKFLGEETNITKKILIAK